MTILQKIRNSVMPAKAGIQNYPKILDSRLRGNDVKGRFKTFYKTINNNLSKRLSEAISLNRHSAIDIIHSKWRK